jgi:RNA polymerase sigma-70 factor (ECF subfamily)
MKEFEEIYKTYYQDVYRFLFRTCGSNHELAEELTQDTFCEAFRSFHRYNSSCSVLTWLCAIGKNLWFHYLRKHKNTAIKLESLEETICDDYEKTPEACAERSEKSDQIRKALSSLKPRYREIIWLRTVGEMSFVQIADMMKITENSAKVLYFRAKNQIKEKLENEGFF